MVFNEKGESNEPNFEMIIVNPVITGQSTETDLEEEGCLSFPLIRGQVYRHRWITVDFQTITGEKKTLKMEGWPAQIFQHEYDHLDKVRFVSLFANLPSRRDFFSVNIGQNVCKPGRLLLPV